MASLIAWAVYDNLGAPAVGLTIGGLTGMRFIDYCDRAGSARAQPAIVELGGGMYGFIPDDTDESTGTCYIVANGENVSPLRVTGGVMLPTTPFSVWSLETDAGDLWTGAAPTIGSYVSSEGARPAPGVVAAKTYLFSVTPTTADLAIGVTMRADSAAGANPAFWQETLVALEAPEPPTPEAPAVRLSLGTLIGVVEDGSSRASGVPANPRASLSMPIGSTAGLTVRVVRPDGSTVTGGTLTWTVKKAPKDTLALFTKSAALGASGSVTFTVAATESKNATAGWYSYDVWLTGSSSQRVAVVPLSPIYMEAAATFVP